MQQEREREAHVDLSRTWELELFISGATLFALLRGPGIVDNWWTHTDPHLSGTLSLAGFFAYYYAKLILYTLISTFTLHLVARSYWVALIGVQSVFPLGVRWSELPYGPNFLRVTKERLPAVETMIRRTDDFSSLLFAGGILTLLTFIVSIAAVVVMGLLAFVFSAIFLGGRYLPGVALAAVCIMAAITLITRAVDQSRGERIPAGSRTGRLLYGASVASYHFGWGSLLGPIAFVLATNLSKRTSQAAVVLVMIGLAGTFLVRDIMLRNNLLYLDSHVYLPDDVSGLATNPVYYADRRAPDAVYFTIPFIQSEIIREPYVRLFIPMVPDNHNPVIAERCPDVRRYGAGNVRGGLRRRTADNAPDTVRLLDCLSRLQPVSLNGTQLAGLPFRLTTDERSGVRGIAAHIPVAGLTAGEHVLRIEGLPRASDDSRPPRAHHTIRFWQ